MSEPLTVSLLPVSVAYCHTDGRSVTIFQGGRVPSPWYQEPDADRREVAILRACLQSALDELDAS